MSSLYEQPDVVAPRRAAFVRNLKGKTELRHTGKSLWRGDGQYLGNLIKRPALERTVLTQLSNLDFCLFVEKSQNYRLWRVDEFVGNQR